MVQKKFDTNKGETKQDMPAATEENVSSTLPEDIHDENLMESDLDDKTPAGDGGPEDDL